ncbi:MAG: DUF2177 family protein [Rhodocyclaceae bacterium]|nr:DUF2177 family protein [Rhodocyclaceae bacterium]
MTPAAMALRRHLHAAALVAAAFLPLDAMWLTLMTPRLYQPGMGHLLAAQPDFAAATAFYLLYFAGVAVFAVRPMERVTRLLPYAARAALFGAVAYGTYDLTNQATLRDWPWVITVSDLCWGAAATALATLIARRAMR